MAARTTTLKGFVITITAILVLGVVVSWFPGWESSAPQMAQPVTVQAGAEEQVAPPDVPVLSPDTALNKEDHVRQRQIQLRFQQAVAMLHTGHYEEAVTALHAVLRLEPRLVEAHVNMGFALLELGSPQAAVDFFETATQLRPAQTNAYYGLGEAYEQLGNLEAAMGAMQAYQHLPDADPAFAKRAAAAVWELRETLRQREQAGAPTGNGAITPQSASGDNAIDQ